MHPHHDTALPTPRARAERPRAATSRWLSSLLLVLTACAAPVRETELPKPSRDLALTGEGYLKVYDNGLSLFVVPDPYTSLLQVDVRHQVGTRDDLPGRSGVAHLVEHLMFEQAVQGPGSATVMDELRRSALDFNAYTSLDHTHYSNTGGAEGLETYLRHTAVRLRFDCALLDEDTFERTREIVRNEHRWRGTGARAELMSDIRAQVYPEGHPYRRDDRDEDEQLASITREDACSFIAQHYTTDRTTIVVTGDVVPEEALALANAQLEAIPRVDAPPRTPLPALELAPGRFEIKAPIDTPTALLVFSTRPRFSAGYEESITAHLVVMMGLMLFTNSARWKGKAPRWDLLELGGPQAPVTAFVVEVDHLEDLDRVIATGLDAIERSAHVQVQNPELGTAYDSFRQGRRLSIVRGVANVRSRARAYADYLEEGSEPGFHGAELAAIDALTAAGVQQALREEFPREQARVIRIVPSEGEATLERADLDYRPDQDEQVFIPESIDPAEAQRALPYTDIVPPELEMLELELDNGMDVVLVRSTAFPLVDTRLIVHGGAPDPSLGALPQLAVDLYSLRPGSREAIENAIYFSRSGSKLYGVASRQGTFYWASGLSIYADFLLTGLGEYVVQGEYTQSFASWKRATRKQLADPDVRRRLDRQQAVLTALYGEGHPFVDQSIHDPAQLRRLRARDLRRFHDRHYRADNCTLVIVGGFDMDLAIEYVRASFETPVLRRITSPWQRPRERPAASPVPEPVPGSTRVITEVDAQRTQTDVEISFPLATTFGDDHAALLVLTDMLDLEVSVVRVKLGASYGVYAYLRAEPANIEISGAIDSKRAGEGLQAILAAVQRVRDGEDLERRFAYARRHVLRTLIEEQGDATSLTDQLTRALIAGQSSDYFQELGRRVATLTPADVQAVTERVLRAERAVTLIQGPAAGVADALERNGIANALALPEVVHDP